MSAVVNERQRLPVTHPRWLRISWLVVGASSALAFAFMVERAVSMVRSGRGLETFRTFWLVEDSWVGLLAFAAFMLVAVPAGLLLMWRQKRQERKQWRELEEKYGKGEAGV